MKYEGTGIEASGYSSKAKPGNLKAKGDRWKARFVKLNVKRANVKAKFC